MARALVVGITAVITVMLSLCTTSAVAQSAVPKLAPLIKLYREEKKEDEKKLEESAWNAAIEYAKAKGEVNAAESPEDKAKAEKALKQAGEVLDQATKDVQTTRDAIRAAEKAGADVGQTFPDSGPVGADPIALKPKGPLGIHLGEPQLFKKLKSMAGNPDSVPGEFDGGRYPRLAATPKATLDTILSNPAEIEARRRNIKQEQDNATEFQRELVANINLAIQEAAKDKDMLKLAQEIDDHRAAAANVNVNNDEQIRQYNAKADRLYYRWKELTGKELGYTYKRIR